MGRCEDESVTADLYPHRRIKITELVKPGPAKPPQVRPQSVKPPTPPSSPSPDRQVVESLVRLPVFLICFFHIHFYLIAKGPLAVQTAFLHKYDISLSTWTRCRGSYHFTLQQRRQIHPRFHVRNRSCIQRYRAA